MGVDGTLKITVKKEVKIHVFKSQLFQLPSELCNKIFSTSVTSYIE